MDPNQGSRRVADGDEHQDGYGDRRAVEVEGKEGGHQEPSRPGDLGGFGLFQDGLEDAQEQAIEGAQPGTAAIQNQAEEGTAANEQHIGVLRHDQSDQRGGGRGYEVEETPAHRDRERAGGLAHIGGSSHVWTG